MAVPFFSQSTKIYMQHYCQLWEKKKKGNKARSWYYSSSIRLYWTSDTHLPKYVVLQINCTLWLHFQAVNTINHRQSVFSEFLSSVPCLTDGCEFVFLSSKQTTAVFPQAGVPCLLLDNSACPEDLIITTISFLGYTAINCLCLFACFFLFVCFFYFR